jgi:mono/diheme cytochrome c family protein
MNSKNTRAFILGAILAYLIPALALVLSAKLGVLPVQADATPSPAEAALLGAVLHSSVAHHATEKNYQHPASSEFLMAGAGTYRELCAHCHGISRESDNSLGRSFYPPAPQFPVTRTSYTDSELFWIVKHGIRNTGMPAWGNLLSDDEIWQVVALVRSFNSLSDSVTEALRHHPK